MLYYSSWKVKRGTLKTFQTLSLENARAYVWDYLTPYTKCGRYVGMARSIINEIEHHSFFDEKGRTLAVLVEVPRR